jgi:hypothetical protein
MLQTAARLRLNLGELSLPQSGREKIGQVGSRPPSTPSISSSLDSRRSFIIGARADRPPHDRGTKGRNVFVRVIV